MESQVKIGREFFAKIKNDYANWKWALVREFLQNCFDAPGCTKVKVSIARMNTGDTILSVENNGDPMTQDILVNKLLTLGGTGKGFQGDATGGFGVAKSLLYYTHKEYAIHTGGLMVSGSGAQYSLTTTDNVLHGTASVIIVEGDHTLDLLEAVAMFARFSQWNGTLTLNGLTLDTNMKKGARRRDLGWGVVYSNQQHQNVCVVRINGQPMFFRSTRYKGCVVVELTGKACDVLTSNRDDLKYTYSSELTDFLTSIAVDKKSALREQRAEYKRYVGEKMRNEAKKPKSMGTLAEILSDEGLGQEGTPEATGDTRKGTMTPKAGGSRLVVTSKEDVSSVSIGQEFIVKNSTGMKTPEYLLPGEKFSGYCKDIVRCWTLTLVKLYEIFDISGEFSVGFVLDEDSLAEAETGVYGLVYYVNPIKVVTQKTNTSCRSFRSRYVGTWADRFEIIGIAVHEFVHGAMGLKEHDEDYAGALTMAMAKVMRHLGDLTPIFKK